MLMAVPPRVKDHGLYDTTMDGLIVDLFAGGGGASIGIEQAFAEAGINRHVDIAINHDPDAIACHTRNHPMTDHIQTDVFDVDPVEVTDGKPVAHLHASPDCTDFSRAKGGKPIRTVQRRSLAWVVIRWIWALGPQNKPRVITLENVPEFEQWSELDENGIPLRDGAIFQIFVNILRYLGYVVEWHRLRACDYGAPTTRDRLFLIARCDGKPINWPEKTHGQVHTENHEQSDRGNHSTNRTGFHHSGKGSARSQSRADVCGNACTGRKRGRSRKCDSIRGKNRAVAGGKSRPGQDTGLKPYRTAAEIIDWSEPMCSIFATPDEAKAWAKQHKRPCPRRPLAENTMKRIFAGLDRHVLNAADPYIVHLCNGYRIDDITCNSAGCTDEPESKPYIMSIANYGNDHAQTKSANDPLSTVTAYPRGGHHAVVTPVIVKSNFGEKPHYRADEPVRTIVAGGTHHAVVAPTLIQIGYGERAGQSPRVPGLDKPLGTVVSGSGKHALVAAYLNKFKGTSPGTKLSDPVHTITAGPATGKGGGAAHSMGVTAAHIVKLKGTCKDGQPATDPLATVQAGGTHYALISEFLIKYYGQGYGQSHDEPLHTIPTHERFGLVTVIINREVWAIVDILMRMLTPRELARAQGFRDDYVIDEGADGKKLSKRVQVRLIGNSVSPPPMQAIIRANVIPHWPKPAKRAKARREAVTA